MIHVENLTKAFGPKLAVNGISFHVERGEVLDYTNASLAAEILAFPRFVDVLPKTAASTASLDRPTVS